MTTDLLTAIMAERVMGWRVGPNRIQKGGRRWAPCWRFQPLRRLDHALQLLEKAAAKYTLTKSVDGTSTARVSLGDRRGIASAKSEAAAITGAVARAIGIDVPDELLEACQE
jgi:hypothetical protein